MKILLACLMCIVLTTSQCFAIKGGPDYGTAQVSVTGTYAGVLAFSTRVPIDPPNPDTPQPTGMNSLGLFTLPIPKTGLANGTALLFEQGQIYTGTIQATGDPDSAKITGIISASFPYVFLVQTGENSVTHEPIFTSQSVIAQASGKLNAKVKANTRVGSASSARLKGTADMQFALTVNNPFDEIIYSVIGFKQANL